MSQHSFGVRIAIIALSLFMASRIYAQSNVFDLSGQTLNKLESIDGWLNSNSSITKLVDGDKANNNFFILVDGVELDTDGAESVLSVGRNSPADQIDGDINLFFICRSFEVRGQQRLRVLKGETEVPLRLFVVGDSTKFSNKSLLQIDFALAENGFDWGGRFYYGKLDVTSDQQFSAFSEFVHKSSFDGSNRIIPSLQDVTRGDDFWTYLYNSSSDGQFLINAASNRPVSKAYSIGKYAYSYRIGRLVNLDNQDDFKGPIEDAVTLWKSRYLKYLNAELQAALLAGNFPKIYSTYKKSRELPFSNVAIGPNYLIEFGENAKQLREQLLSNLPGIVKEVLQDDLPGGKATLQMFGVPKKGQFRIAPHESPVVVLANSKLGTVTYDSGNESFEVSVDVELGVSPAAIKPAKQYIGKVFEYAGTQPIKVTDIGCSFPGIAGVKFNDLGSGRLKLSFVLKGDKSGLALTQFSNNIGVPITITADVEGEGDVVQFSSIYTVSLAKRNRSDVSISGGKIHNLSSRSVYVGWLAGANGEVFLPKDGRPQFVDANKEISVDQFSEAGAATKVPPAALEYVVANPLQELDFQDTNAIEKLSVTNGILPVFQQAGVDQFLSYVEVEITESWDGNTIKHGPFLLSPKNAQGSDLILPLIKHPNRKLNLSGRLVFSNGGFKNLKSQTIDGLSLLINTQMIE
jgi:hypothetical protein